MNKELKVDGLPTLSSLKPHQLERQLQRLRRQPEGVDGGGDGRPKDTGAMLEALRRVHGLQGRSDIYKLKK